MTDTELVEALQDAESVLFGEFELSHGGTSEYYIDKYRFETKPEPLALIAERFGGRLNGTVPAGVALGAVPLVATTALEANCSYLIVRKASKEYGTGKRIEGDLKAGEQVTVLEDVATTGQSALDAVNALRDAGATVNRVLVVVDREEGAQGRLAEQDVKLEALVTASELLSTTE